MPRLLIVLILVLFCTPNTQAQFYNGTQMSFGKNRVQYQAFEWQFFQFKKFDTFFYKGGRELAEFTGRTADAEIVEIEKLFDYQTEDRLQFIIFNKLSDLKQTNLGLEAETQLNNTGGVTRIFGNKILIYFNGDHQHLRQQIRSGIARVLFEQLMYGGSVKDRLQSSILLNIPDWYINGLTQWVAKGWTIDDENRMRDGIRSGKFKKINNLAAYDADFAGQSMWHFVDQVYGKASIANMLYMTRLNRNIESGFNFVIGATLKQTNTAWRIFYEKRYLNSDNGKQNISGKPLRIKSKNSISINQIKLSPDGNKISYVTNEMGKYKIFLYDIKSKKRKRIAKGGYRSLVQETDLSFPVLAWHPTGKSLTFIKEAKGNLWLSNYQLKGRKTESNKLLYFEKVNDFSYADDGQSLVMSATQKGQSDIFVWNVRARVATQITKDLYDDKEPRFTNNMQRIIFTSNRSNDTLNMGDFYSDALKNTDVFLYDYTSRSNILARITQTPTIAEYQPMEADSGRYLYLSDAFGVRNRMLATVDSTISFVDTTEHYRFIVRQFNQTNYARNVLQHDVNYKRNGYVEKFIKDGKIQITVNPLPQPFMDTNHEVYTETNVPALTIPTTKKIITPADTQLIDLSPYYYQSEFKFEPVEHTRLVHDTDSFTTQVPFGVLPGTGTTSVLKSDSVIPYRLPKQRNYDLSFNLSYFVTQLDNNLLNPTYQAYTGGSEFYFGPGLNGLFLAGVNELMEDHKLIGGMRISGNLNSNEFYVSYENLRNRFDKTWSFYRQAREDYIGYAPIKILTQELRYKIKYPFNDVSSLRGSIGFRADRGVVRSIDQPTLEFPNDYLYWGTAKIEYVFDNTINRGVNLLQGARCKIFAEAFNQVDESKSFLGVVGFDYRHYTRISRQIIWANRLAASTSMGDLKLIYYLGSVDNALAPSDNFDPTIRVDQSQNYAFQAVATNMRGFKQNIRNGNSFVLLNSELRVPVFQYFAQAPIRSDFIRNFMIVPFFDAGTAWTSTSPYSKDNNLNLDIITQGPLTITVNKNTDPIVMGYGFGLHSRLLGYYMRADWGWSFADNEHSEKPLFNFSLSLDF